MVLQLISHARTDFHALSHTRRDNFWTPCMIHHFSWFFKPVTLVMVLQLIMVTRRDKRYELLDPHETQRLSCKCLQLVLSLENEMETPRLSCKCLDLIYILENKLQTPRSSCKCLDLVYSLEVRRPSVHLTTMIGNLLTQVRSKQTKCTPNDNHCQPSDSSQHQANQVYNLKTIIGNLLT